MTFSFCSQHLLSHQRLGLEVREYEDKKWNPRKTSNGTACCVRLVNCHSF